MNICTSLEAINELARASKGEDRLHYQAEACVHEAAYKLAASAGSNTEIAQAAIQTCEGSISRIGREALAGMKPTQQVVETLSASTQIMKDEFLEPAKTWVIESRAGDCSLLFGASK